MNEDINNINAESNNSINTFNSEINPVVSNKNNIVHTVSHHSLRNDKNIVNNKVGNDKDANNRVYNLSKIAFYILAICIFSIAVIMFMIMAFSTQSHKTLYFNETVKVDDKVILKKNNYYKEDHLINQNTYITALMDKVVLDYMYNINLSNMVDYDITYNADAILLIHEVDNPDNVLWSKKEKFIDKKTIDNSGKNSFKINESIEFDYNKYDKLVKNFVKDYVLITESKLKIVFNIFMDCVDSDYSDEFDYEKTIIVEVPMNKQTMSIVKSYESLDNGVLDSASNSFNMFSIVYLILGIALLALDVVFLYKLYVILRDNAFKRTVYQKTLDNILRSYDHIIVSAKTAPTFDGLSVIEVNRFEELLDAQEELRIPIVHCEIISDKKSVFVIISNNNAWVYYLQESE